MIDRILITGATGCLGSNLTKRLIDEGADVVVFKRHGEHLGPLVEYRRKFETRFGDVRDADSCRRAMAGITRLYHLAGIAVPLNRLAPLMWDINVMGTHNVLRAAAEQGVARVVHVSSISAIGYPPHGTVASETFDFRDSASTNSYSVTKRHGETIALGFNGAGMEVVVVNPSAVIAPGGDRRYSWTAVIDTAIKQRVWAIPTGGSGFCGGRDLVDGLQRAMERGRAGERYILNSVNLSYAELARMVGDVSGAARPQVRIAPALLALAGHVNDLRSAFHRDLGRLPTLVSETADLMSRQLYYDPSKARDELQFSPSPLIDAVRDVYEWCKTSPPAPALLRSTWRHA
jgi:dihydroflavonol-4-reductase